MTVEQFSQNGYISFKNFQNVLHRLKITEIWGNEVAQEQLNHILMLHNNDFASEFGKL